MTKGKTMKTQSPDSVAQFLAMLEAAMLASAAYVVELQQKNPATYRKPR